jgi:hypothetical protein
MAEPQPLLPPFSAMNQDIIIAGIKFHSLAIKHKQWAQLWFTISACVLLAGVMVLIAYLQTKTSYTEWNQTTYHLFTEFLTFSFFYVVWNWSVRNFRAHWYNFISGSYRARALDILEKMAKEHEGDANEIRKVSVRILLEFG